MLPYCLNGTNVPDFITRQTYVVITCIWRDMGYVAFRHFCRESGFVANTRFFGCILSRLLLRHRGFYSDFVQISVQNIGGWDLCSQDSGLLGFFQSCPNSCICDKWTPDEMQN